MPRLKKIEPSAASRLFSAKVIQELARKGKSPIFSRLVKESKLIDFFDKSKNISHIFDLAFHLLERQEYRNEYTYKVALIRKILLGIHSLNTASMINEFRIGSSKADIVILNGTGTVYEIKSERDSLRRLKDQLTSYLNVFASVNVLAGKNHLREIIDTVPEEVGILFLSDRFQISTVREPNNDPSRTNSIQIFDSLTTLEAGMIINDLGLDLPVVPNIKRHNIYKKIFSEINPEMAHSSMIKILKKTRTLSLFNEFIHDIPFSLYPTVLSSRFKKQDQKRLMETLEIPASQAVLWA